MTIMSAIILGVGRGPAYRVFDFLRAHFEWFLDVVLLVLLQCQHLFDYENRNLGRLVTRDLSDQASF